MRIMHPSVSWIELSEDEVQILLPDGNHVTVSGLVDDIVSGLEAIKKGVVDSVELEDPSVLEELVSILESVGAIRFGEISELGSTLDEYADFHMFNRNKMLSKPLPKLPLFNVKGDPGSVVFGLANKLVQDENLMFDGDELDIACADWEDYSMFRRLNAEAVKNQKPILFVRWLGDELVIGPLVYSNDSPCYECFIARRKSSVNYLPEYLASIKKNGSQLKSDAVFESFFNYAVGRYLKFLRKGAYHLAPVGGVERWDPIRGEKSNSIVHKIPRCDSCGLSNKNDPQVSIRDLL